jgi:2'-hydroxyisoflavone reductase
VNVTSAPGSATYGEMLDACLVVTGADARLTWVPDDLLTAYGVEPWTELPLWAPETDDFAHVWDVDSTRAREAGLRTRPLDETVADTWTALQDEDLVARRPGMPGHGIDPTKERVVLEAAAG